MQPTSILVRKLAVLAAFSLLTPAFGAVVTATFNSAATVPITAASYNASGNSVDLTLNFAPPTGTALTVVKNTGLAFIGGAFDNLAQGQTVSLAYNGISYPFVANYYGGTGNDLVLQWANTRPFGWGGNTYGNLGDGTTTNQLVPVPVVPGALAGKSVIGLVSGRGSALAVTADGALVSWGLTPGNGSDLVTQPALVDRSGVLSGKTAVAVAVGGSHDLVLCKDGTLAAWGDNSYGQLGNGTTTSTTTPVAATLGGVLAGKTVAAVAGGDSHTLVLCTDGTLATWGRNNYGQLGNGTTTNSSVPVLVNRSGVLSGKTVSQITCGSLFCLVLCTDGTLASWGYNSEGELGNGATTQSNVPVLVNRSGVLSGKTVTAIAAGGSACAVACSDGIAATWGYNAAGQLGTGNNTQSTVPVLVDRSGVLAGKTVIGVSCGDAHTTAICSDGTLTAWGGNSGGRVGNNSTTNTNLPVLVDTRNLASGEVFATVDCGFGQTLALVASLPAPVAITQAATSVRNSTATLNGTAIANGGSAAVSFEYGLTTAYTATIAATPATVSGSANTAVSADLTDLIPGATYHFRLVATGAGGTVKGSDLTFTTASNAVLTALAADQGSLWPTFSTAVFRYDMVVPYSVTSVRFTPTAVAGATVQVNGAPVASGTASAPIPLSVGSQPVTLAVAAADGINTCSYDITVIRRPEVFTFGSAGEIPLTVGGLKASGSPVQFALGFAPSVGTSLTVVNNTGLAPIEGAFDNLPQGQRVDLTFGGMSYSFVANYFGGNGNDLVLEWANRRLFAWGYNSYGQLGNNTITNSPVPVPVEMKGVLAGRTVTMMTTGTSHVLACCVDGSVAAWGENGSGQLGIGSTTASRVPITVNMTGVLAGKKVVAVAAGSNNSLVLCADGTLAAWGGNLYGQLGDNSTSARSAPVLVNRSGVLAGRRVVAIAARGSHCLALCADGTLASWGENTAGQLGNGSTTHSSVPVLVDRSGVLLGKQVIAIAAGTGPSLALCADGSVAAWGDNAVLQLGTSGIPHSTVPVLVNRSGVLAGKTVTAISSFIDFNFARCADGSVVGWGGNADGQLGASTASASSAPVLVNMAGTLAGKTIARITPAGRHSLALCADGTLAAWGYNSYGQLGNNTQTNSLVPVAVNTTSFKTGETAIGVFGGGFNSFALTALPAQPVVTTLPAADLADTTVTLAANVSANGSDATAYFEWGPTEAYGFKLAATPATVSGAASTGVSAALTDLISGNTYHYRAVATNAGGTTVGDDVVFTTPTNANLASLSLDAAELATPFVPARARYAAAVPNATAAISVTAVTAKPDSTLRINGAAVASGTASAPQTLTEGDNTIIVVVTAADGVETMIYQILVTRLPSVFSFANASTVPMTVGDFAPSGNAVFGLNFTPPVGTALTVVNNTGHNPIRGTFANLVQGQRVEIPYGSVSFAFVANYFGGTGNDLVLQWANTRLLTWGGGQTIPAGMSAPGVLAGKTVTSVASGQGHTLALCADGTVAGWGSNGGGELGTGTTTDSTAPVAVSTSGVLAGKTVVAIAAGYAQSLALCSDGALVTWGRGFEGQSGNGTVTSSIVPVLVNRSGVLAGKTVVAIASGTSYMLALCSDGSLASWGSNQYGALGIGNLVNSSVPVMVDRGGVLLGKRIASIAAGGYHGIALCDDGMVADWGGNGNAQLGNGVWVDSPLPVALDQTGVLAGKRIVELVGGGYHSLARCADGTLVAWGTSDRGQLGNNSTSSTAVPVQVVQTGVLAGKSVVSLAAGVFHSLALCSDGTLAAWGYNDGGQLGNNSKTQSLVPVSVTTSALRTGERVLALDGGTASSVALVASPLQTATSLAATAITGTGADLHGTVNANGNTVSVAFEYGLDNSYGASVAGVPPTVSGTATAVGATLTGLAPGTIYHFRAVATGIGGTVRGADLTFTTLSNNARLAGLALSSGALVPAFLKEVTPYLTTVPFEAASVTLTPTTDHPGATVKINGTPVASGAASGVIPLPVGNTVIATVVTAEDRVTTKTYTISVTRLPLEFAFNAAADVPVTANGFAAGGYPATLKLNYAPVPGTILTMVNNTGLGFISGAFGNLAQGQRVTLSYGGNSYDFAVNYYGGTGNDLVLQWADTLLLAWGANEFGQLGDGTTVRRLVPTGVAASGVLAGKTVTSVAGGYLHSLALTSDGALAAWGYNIFGQLGDGGTASGNVPVAVEQTGSLRGRTVVAIAAGPFHNLALCADGGLVAWGYNNHGQLGDGTTETRRTPVRVRQAGALAGKQVVGIAAGAYQSFARCADGTVAAWGYNDEGELGNGNATGSLNPVAVAVKGSGTPESQQVVSIAAGQYHTLALCADGTLVSWGYNNRGQVGVYSTGGQKSPVAVNWGALKSRVPVAIAAGAYHSLAWCSDGTLAAWGDNRYGQLGTAGLQQSTAPLAVDLAGISPASIATGGNHNLLRLNDGRLAAWGDNSNGQLGDGGAISRPTPAAVVFAGQSAMFTASGSSARHNLAVVAAAPERSPTLTAIAAVSDEAGLLAYAFQLDPRRDLSGQLPQGRLETGEFVIRFTQPAARDDIGYGAEWSATMEPGSWRNVPDTGVGGEHRFAIPAAGQPQGFLRLKVTRE